MPRPLPPPPSPPKIVRELPPEQFLRECGVPVLEGPTTGDLVDAYINTHKALLDCNANMRALRNWTQEFDKDQDD